MLGCTTFWRSAGLTAAPRAIVDIVASVADAYEKKSSSSDPEILSQFEAISDPEEATAFYNKHQTEILAGFEARKYNP
jgi:hypothetical protein